jgi:hypothetical protein
MHRLYKHRRKEQAVLKNFHHWLSPVYKTAGFQEAEPRHPLNY